jgi:flagellar biosynthesis/type III secretory pathway chaperone
MDGPLDKLLDRLISVIGGEAALFQKFLELLEKQQQALIQNDTEGLGSITEGLHAIVARSQKLERERAEVVEQIRITGSAEDDLNVCRICDMADENRSIQLKNLRETILGLYSDIEETRMRNGLLVEQSLEQIRHTLQLISRVPSRKETYRQKGEVFRDFAPLGIDRRV